MKNIFRKSNRGGFTIVETLVAIAILVTAVMGTMSAIQGGLSSYIFSKDQIVAFYLAQEGFEQVRNIRDENRLNGRNWLAGLASDSSDPCYFGQACLVSPVESPTPTRCPSPGACPKLRQSADTGFYGYNSFWGETIYRREVTLSQVSQTEVAITITVNWSKGLVVREFRARENLLNW